MFRTSFLRLAFLLAQILVTSFAAAQAQPTLHLQNGDISGSQSTDGKVAIFKGIPYAAPPVLGLRWKAPQPPANWSGVRECTQFGPSAVQNPPLPFFVWSEEFMAPLSPISEDCLYLNVWSPNPISTTEKLPVIVWIHGGGFMSGAGACPIYDGEGMAKKGVVFVTINYRLGVFGFLAHPELSRESGTNSSGNYALLDMIAALKWVQQNIAAFGGDPDRVTIAGQSAGSFAVNALMASPVAKGLFHRAIGESGAMFGDRALSLPAASLQGIELVKKLNRYSISDLRSLPADTLLKYGGGYSPVLDGYVVPTDVHTIFTEGKQNDVPLLTGYNRDEGFVFGETMTAGQFRTEAKNKYGGLAEEFLKAFPATDDAVAKQSQKNLSRDETFAWQCYTWARLQSKTGQSKAWLYRFDRVPPGRPDLAEEGAFHSAEIAYALHSLPMWKRPWEKLDEQLSEQMSSYWANFAATGDPNGKGLPKWEAFNPAAPNTLVFAKKTEMKSGLEQSEFAFLDKWKVASTPDLTKYEAITFKTLTDTINVRLLMPENYDHSKEYPLVLFLHGGGERGSDNEKQLVHGAKMFLKPENRRDFPCVVVFPQCPSDSFWASVKTDRSKTPPDRDFNYNYEITKGLRQAIEVTKALAAYDAIANIDTNRIYITGLSMGGMGTFEAVARYPGLFAAAAPICGGGDVRAFSIKEPYTPMRIFHGSADSVVDVKYSWEMFDALKQLTWPVEYIEYPMVGHNSWDFAFAEKDFLAWLFAKKKGK